MCTICACIKKKTFLFIHAYSLYINYINVNFQCQWIKYVMIRTSITTKSTHIFMKWQLLDMCSYFENKKILLKNCSIFFSTEKFFDFFFSFSLSPPPQIFWKKSWPNANFAFVNSLWPGNTVNLKLKYLIFVFTILTFVLELYYVFPF